MYGLKRSPAAVNPDKGARFCLYCLKAFSAKRNLLEVAAAYFLA